MCAAAHGVRIVSQGPSRELSVSGCMPSTIVVLTATTPSSVARRSCECCAGQSAR